MLPSFRESDEYANNTWISYIVYVVWSTHAHSRMYTLYLHTWFTPVASNAELQIAHHINHPLHINYTTHYTTNYTTNYTTTWLKASEKLAQPSIWFVVKVLDLLGRFKARQVQQQLVLLAENYDKDFWRTRLDSIDRLPHYWHSTNLPYYTAQWI